MSGRVGVLLCGHGSRDAGAVAEFAELAAQLPGTLPADWLYLEGTGAASPLVQ